MFLLSSYIYIQTNSVAEFASELYRPSDSRLSAKLVPTLADADCDVVNVTHPYGRILDFLDRSRHFFISSSSWIVMTRLSGPRPVSENLAVLGIEPGPLDLQPETLTTRPQRRPKKYSPRRVSKPATFRLVAWSLNHYAFVYKIAVYIYIYIYIWFLGKTRPYLLGSYFLTPRQKLAYEACFTESQYGNKPARYSFCSWRPRLKSQHKTTTRNHVSCKKWLPTLVSRFSVPCILFILYVLRSNMQMLRFSNKGPQVCSVAQCLFHPIRLFRNIILRIQFGGGGVKYKIKQS
jgi:hypothetical protein